MEYLIEFVLELILEGSIEVSKNKKLPKYIRYPLIIMIILFFIAVIVTIFVAGFILIVDNLYWGLFILLIGLLLLLSAIIKFRKVYLNKNDKNNNI